MLLRVIIHKCLNGTNQLLERAGMRSLPVQTRLEEGEHTNQDLNHAEGKATHKMRAGLGISKVESHCRGSEGERAMPVYALKTIGRAGIICRISVEARDLYVPPARKGASRPEL